MVADNFQIINQEKEKPLLPRALFSKMAEKVLGKKYELELVFTNDANAKKINKKYRNKTYIPNVLSFPLDKNTGQIFINQKKAILESAEFKMSPKKFIAYLFIHGCLHLKGLDHGSLMDKKELTLLRTLYPYKK